MNIAIVMSFFVFIDLVIRNNTPESLDIFLKNAIRTKIHEEEERKKAPEINLRDITYIARKTRQ